MSKPNKYIPQQVPGSRECERRRAQILAGHLQLASPLPTGRLGRALAIASRVDAWRRSGKLIGESRIERRNRFFGRLPEERK